MAVPGGPPTLTLEQASTLVIQRDGVLLCAGLPGLAVPMMAIPGTTPLVILGHFAKARTRWLESLSKMGARSEAREARLLFQVGLDYLDPTWIPVAPHAPTEVKAVFEFVGTVQLIQREEIDLRATLATIATARQLRHGVRRAPVVADLPGRYVRALARQLQEFTLTVDRYEVVTLMVLDHLRPRDRLTVVERLRRTKDPDAHDAARIITMTVGTGRPRLDPRAPRK